MANLDPRYSGENNPSGFNDYLDSNRKPDGYKRKESETKPEKELESPYHRDVNVNRNLGIV